MSRRSKSACPVLAAVLFLLPTLVRAGLYFEYAFETGGDTLASERGFTEFYNLGEYERDLDIGGGDKLAIGIHNLLGENKDRSLTIALGYLSDRIDAVNGDADYDAVTLDIVYGFRFESHRFGLGASFHLDSEFRAKFDNQPETTIKFDDATGLLMQYGYAISPAFQVGMRYTAMDYEVNGSELDASSFGLFVAYATP